MENNIIRLANKLFAIMLAFVFSGFFVACSDDDDEKLSEYVSSFDVEPIVLDAIASETTINFVAGGNWSASCNNTNIKISPRSGNPGKITMTITATENKTLNERKAILIVSDASVREPYKLSITQLGIAPIVKFNVSNASLNLNLDRKTFVDTVKVTSNIEWYIKEKPQWIKNYQFLDQKEPSSGNMTEIQLELIADVDLLTPQEMKEPIILSDRNDETVSYPLDVVFEGFSPLLTAEKVIFGNTESENFNRVKMMVKSNEKWTLISKPEWIAQFSTVGTPCNAILTETSVWMDFDQNFLDTDNLSGEIVLKGSASQKEYIIDVEFIGVGQNYVDFDREGFAEFSFDATKYDENWNIIETAVTSKIFNIYASGDYTYTTGNINKAPFEIFILEAPGNIPQKQIASWAGVAPAEVSTRSPIKGKPFELWVSSRAAMDVDVTKPRTAHMFIVPKFNKNGDEILLDSLFDDNGKIRMNYEKYGMMFQQKGLNVNYTFDCETLEDNILVPAAGEEYIFPYTSNTEMLSWVCNNDFGMHCDWVSAYFEVTNSGETTLRIVVKPNSGGIRSEWFAITGFVADGVDDQVLRERITIRQEGAK